MYHHPLSTPHLLLTVAQDPPFLERFWHHHAVGYRTRVAVPGAAYDVLTPCTLARTRRTTSTTCTPRKRTSKWPSRRPSIQRGTARREPRRLAAKARRETSWTSSPHIGPGLLQAARLTEDVGHLSARALVEPRRRLPRTPCQHGASVRGARRTSARVRPTAGMVGDAEPHRWRWGHATVKVRGLPSAARAPLARAHLQAVLLT